MSVETNFAKNSCFDDDKSFWPIFPRIIECDNPLETNYNGPQAFRIITVGIITAFFST